ncbi:MAG: Asp-tRNA(Asn)/Glu-tRNA(Gln) amidotransferase subunit GatC [Alphaproteobacteria bacterium]|nr:Asp-tRNA(Asn)/Glu-tRNA(Gln) amidotransferase subunit GatC [Alphaproteobacteria bacterium]
MLTKDAVAKIAHLSRLRLSGEEAEHYAAEISAILTWIEQLAAVDTQGVPQMVSVADLRLPWRKDEVTDGTQPEAVLQNAPAADHGCFLVPKVME